MEETLEKNIEGNVGVLFVVGSVRVMLLEKNKC